MATFSEKTGGVRSYGSKSSLSTHKIGHNAVTTEKISCEHSGQKYSLTRISRYVEHF